MSVTTIPTAGIANDAVDNTKLDLTSNYAFTGTVTGTDGGISQADFWLISSSISLSAKTFTVLTSWARPTDADDEYGRIGTGMTHSSGVFTFPSTGIYKITYIVTGFRDGESRYAGMQIYGTANNGTAWDSLALSYEGATNADANDNFSFTMIATSFFDVTDTSTHKIKFYVNAAANCGFRGDTDRNNTCMIFERVGDT